MFLDAHTSGMLPLYVSLSDLGTINGQNLESKFETIIKKQYKNHLHFDLGEKSSRVIFIDDIDRLPTNAKLKNTILQYIETNFSSIIITASPDIEINDLLDTNTSDLLANYETYEIKPFGHRMRHKLIQKWCRCSDLESKLDLDKKTHQVENLLNDVIGKNFVPSRPIYLLILLQSTESNEQGELESSSFSYYYQYLITKSLSEVGIKGNQLGEIFNYLSQLAWFFKSSNKKQLSQVEMIKFNNCFTEKFISVDFENRTKTLIKAKIISNEDSYYSFRYPYIYYYFIGKYLSTKLHLQDTKDLIEEYCNNLHKKENADCVLFLTHHQNDTWITDKVSETLNKCFEDESEIELSSDVSTLNSLVKTSAELIISDIDVNKSQEDQRRIADEANGIEEKMDDESEDKPDGTTIAKKLNSLIKTAEILGQITKNYYGTIERKKKESYICAVFNGSLRMLKCLFDEILKDPISFSKNIEQKIKEKSQKLDSTETERLAKQTAFDIIGLVCTGVIARTAQFVNSEKLEEDLSSVIHNNNNTSYRLIGAAIYLMKPGRIPFDELKSLSSQLSDNKFAFKILQSLVVYHLHMFHTKDSDKQKLCSYTKITMEEARNIDFKTSKKKMLN